jgi:aspartate carbamoyltransferase catalytic subunit
MEWTRRHLLGLAELSPEEILYILETAEGFREVSARSVKKVPALRGRVVVNLFFEVSTRTRISFELAGTRLSADVIDFNGSSSSTKKGESLCDTARNIEAMGTDIFIVRHSAAGAPHQIARAVKACVVNAGDGAHEHPTQGLLDIFTIKDQRGSLEGMNVAIVGDISHSRVARSNIWGLKKLGANVFLVGPPTLAPTAFEKLGCHVCHNLDEIMPKIDCFNMLRIQLERQDSGLFPSLREYSRLFGLNNKRMQRAKRDCLVLHPGPINRGVEITPEVADGRHSVILNQVTNGLAVRMAVLYLITGAGKAGAA